MIEWQDVVQQVKDADVVLGVDVATGMETVFYGKALLQRTAHVPEGEGMKAKIVRVNINWHSDDRERIAAACLAVKGHHDWEK